MSQSDMTSSRLQATLRLFAALSAYLKPLEYRMPWRSTPELQAYGRKQVVGVQSTGTTVLLLHHLPPAC